LIEGLNCQSKSSSVLSFRKLGGLQVPLHLAVLADQQFILQDQLQELRRGQAVAGGFLETHLQRRKHAGQS
jgi:hypothetical protein